MGHKEHLNHTRQGDGLMTHLMMRGSHSGSFPATANLWILIKTSPDYSVPTYKPRAMEQKTNNTPASGSATTTTTTTADPTTATSPTATADDNPPPYTDDEYENKNKLLPSPLITSIAWGKIQISGLGPGLEMDGLTTTTTTTMKDVKLWPGGGRRWDWAETGTRHKPGIQLADVEEVIAVGENGAEVVVLSTGMEERLGVSDGLVEVLEGILGTGDRDDGKGEGKGGGGDGKRNEHGDGHGDGKGKGVKRVFVLETREAVRVYNSLAERGVRVGGLFHSTC